jgi:hypothetical protein
MSNTAKVYIYEFGVEEPVKVLEAETLSDALALEYESFPADAKLYHGNVIADDKKVHFLTDEEKFNMAFAKGEFSLIIVPAYMAIIYAVIAIAVALLATTLLAPQVPSMGGGAPDSSNNSLAERENQQRLNGLVPEIFGIVRAAPDLIQVPYSVYVNDIEVEYTAMCLGRGRYYVDTNKIWDDTTLIKNIEGTVVDIYNANEAPNNPFDTRLYGTQDDVYFDDVVWDVKKCNGVNGQELKAPNVYPPGDKWSDTFIIENKGITNVLVNIFAPQGVYRNDSGSIIYTNVSYSVGIAPVDSTGAILSGYSELVFGGFIEYNGTRKPRGQTRYCSLYTTWWKQGTIGNPPSGGQTEVARNSAILAVWAENIDPSTPLWITRIRNNDTGNPNSPDNKRGDQLIIATYDGTDYGSWGRNFESTGSNPATSNIYTHKYERPTWVTVYKETATNSGIIDTNSNQKIHLLIDYRQFSSTTQPVEYSSTNTTRQDYLNLNPNIHYGGGFDRIAVRAIRTSDFTSLDPQYVQDIDLKAVYTRSPVKKLDFGNVTTVYTKTFATEGALSLKKRKLQMEVARAIRCHNRDGDYITINGQSGGIVPLTNSGTASVFTGSASLAPYIPTNRTDHILASILRDPLLGNIPFSSIDFLNIYNTLNTVSNYFASGDLKPSGVGDNYPLSVTATGFNYTFDKEDMSAQEMLSVVTSVCHLTGYREFNIYKLLFEYTGMIPKLLFNHRNKVPDTNQRTVTCGTKENYDGVTVDWRDPTSNDINRVYKVPIDGKALNPLKVDLVGIRNERQAFRHAYRTFFGLNQKNVIEEFEALPEAQILNKGVRIYSADNTRSKILDGEVVGVSGTTLTLSQDADLTGLTNPYIFLQHKNGTVQSLPITQGSSANKVVYSGTLTNSLVTDPSYYALTVYQILSDEHKRERSFIVDERTTGENGTFRIKATVFNPAIYIADKMTFWLQPVDVNFTDRTPNRRNPIPVGYLYIASDATRGYALVNDSPASYMKFDTGNDLILPSSFTFMAWIKLTAAGTTREHAIFSTLNGVTFRFYVYESGGSFTLRASRGSTTTFLVSTPLANATSDWNHVAVTFNANSQILRLYLNGVLKDTLSGVDTHANPSMYLAGNGASQGFKGRLDGLIMAYDVADAETIRNFYLFDKTITPSTKY